MDEYSLYLHIPFCRKRCSYCDFNTYAGMESLRPDYVKALCQEISQVGKATSYRLPVHTIYFGGGTPSLVELQEWELILDAITNHFHLLPGLEMSLEANPGTIDQDYLSALRHLGFNRLSIGMQSANPEELQLLERLHSTPDVIRAVNWARKAGFENLNLDLILGLPHQTLEQWQETLRFALNLNPDHLSVYALIVEPGTPLFQWVNKGLVANPDNDLAADMFDWTEEALGVAGYEHYEISNWARISSVGKLMACRHNLQYWRNQPYLGFGSGAHGYAAGLRTINQSGIRPYLQKMNNQDEKPFPQSPANIQLIPLDSRTEMQETMMVGLRLLDEGVSEKTFSERFGLHLSEVFSQEIRDLVQKGLLEWCDQPEKRLRLTKRGHLLGNQVFMQFVDG